MTWAFVATLVWFGAVPTWGLQYSSSQLKILPDSSAKLFTEMDLSNDWNSPSIMCWNCSEKTN